MCRRLGTLFIMVPVRRRPMWELFLIVTEAQFIRSRETIPIR